MPGQRRRSTARRAERTNRLGWNRTSASYDRRHATALERCGGRAWGLWRIPEDGLRLLGPVRGLRVLELGCGGGRWSIGLVRRGARPIGVDLSEAQLHLAARLEGRQRVHYPLVQATAHRLPFRSATFDRVISDWGALTFADPRQAIPEAARVLRPGGRLVFATSSPWRIAAQSRRTGRVGRHLRQPYFSIREVRYPGEATFTLPYSTWIDLFRTSGLLVERLVEPPASRRGSTYLTRDEGEFGRRWPLESIWVLTRTEPSRRGVGAERGKPPAIPARTH